MDGTELVGAMTHLTADVMLRALSSVQQGKIYQLAFNLEAAMPHLADSQEIGGGDRLNIKLKAHDFPQYKTRIFSETISFPAHSGTHIDAFSHFSKNSAMYGGLKPEHVYAEDGMKQLGLECVAPILTRGVLIDIAHYQGREVLPGGTTIEPEQIQAALKQVDVNLEAGDVPLIRTGWARYWEDPKTYMSQAPGLSRRAAHWIADQKCVAIGIDQWIGDTVPAQSIEDRRSCNEVCLVERGLHLIKSLNLEQIAKDKVYEFLFIAMHPPVKGATGFPIQALAII
jgi:kynurenine formamidase